MGLADVEMKTEALSSAVKLRKQKPGGHIDTPYDSLAIDLTELIIDHIDGLNPAITGSWAKADVLYGTMFLFVRLAGLTKPAAQGLKAREAVEVLSQAQLLFVLNGLGNVSKADPLHKVLDSLVATCETDLMQALRESVDTFISPYGFEMFTQAQRNRACGLICDVYIHSDSPLTVMDEGYV